MNLAIYSHKTNHPIAISFFIIGFCFFFNSKANANLDTKACKSAKANSLSTTIKNRDGSQKISVLDYKQAFDIFNNLRNPKYKIPYLSAEKNCEARAHLISEILFNEFKISSVKVFIQSDKTDDNTLSYGATGAAYLEGEETSNTTLSPVSTLTGLRYNWDYHTAPAVCLTKNGKTDLYVFDPSFFNAPVPYSEWQKTITPGLSKSDFSSYSTSMYNISRLEDSRPSPRRTTFDKANSSLMQKQLRADWKEHNRIKASQKPKVNFNKAVDAVE